LRIREAIAVGLLKAQRDNRGFWRVSFEEARAVSARMSAVEVAPAKLVEILFDEVEETTAALAERTADVERLTGLLDRQQALLERALQIAEQKGDDGGAAERLAALNERSQALVDRALTELETRGQEFAKVNGFLDRAMQTASALDAEVSRQTETSKRQRALLDRVFALAQASLDRFSPSPRGGWLSRWRAPRRDAD
jgi:hypothetical protein